MEEVKPHLLGLLGDESLITEAVQPADQMLHLPAVLPHTASGFDPPLRQLRTNPPLAWCLPVRQGVVRPVPYLFLGRRLGSPSGSCGPQESTSASNSSTSGTFAGVMSAVRMRLPGIDARW